MTLRTTASIFVSSIGLLVAACGGGGGEADAGTPDASISDASLPDAVTTGLASITVTIGGTPLAGADVVLHDPAGEVTASLKTDVNGRAEAEVAAGAMLTVIVRPEPDDEGFRVTYMDVEPGDALELAFPSLSAEDRGTASVTLSPFEGAPLYRIDVECMSLVTTDISFPITVYIDESCVSPNGNFHIVATALDAAWQPIAFSTLRDIPSDPYVPVPVTMPAWRQDFGTLDVVGTDVPPAGRLAAVQTWLDADHVSFQGPSDQKEVFPGSSATLSVRYPAGFASLFDYQVMLGLGSAPDDLESVSMIRVRTEAPPPPTDVMSFAEDFLPGISLPAVTAVDPARPEIAWTAHGDLSTTDGAAFTLVWSPIEGPPERWILLAPPGVASPARVPALPEALADWRPPSGVTHMAQIMFLDADWVQSYDELRNELGVAFLIDGEAIIPRTEVSARVLIAGLL
jgi:hypothetical protein